MLWDQISVYGLTSEDPSPMSLMDPVILALAWILSLPAAFVEAATPPLRRRWVAPAAACVATAILAWFGSLPARSSTSGGRSEMCRVFGRPPRPSGRRTPFGRRITRPAPPMVSSISA
jgi:hypothetical protein